MNAKTILIYEDFKININFNIIIKFPFIVF